MKKATFRQKRQPAPWLAHLMPALLALVMLLPLGVLWAIQGQQVMELLRAAVKLAALP